jgi:regulator of replication initiation timing
MTREDIGAIREEAIRASAEIERLRARLAEALEENHDLQRRVAQDLEKARAMREENEQLRRDLDWHRKHGWGEPE